MVGFHIASRMFGVYVGTRSILVRTDRGSNASVCITNARIEYGVVAIIVVGEEV